LDMWSPLLIKPRSFLFVAPTSGWFP